VNGLDEKIMATLPATFNCESCIAATSKRTSFPSSETKTTRILELLHMDLAGPAEVMSIGGKRYLLIIADEYSRFYHSILLAKKSDAFESATAWIAMQEKRTGLSANRIRTDGGGEFVSALWKSYYTERGITHEKTVPYSAEQNGKSERAVGIVKNGTRTYLFESGLSLNY
jgi:transposase InsO family protein